MAGAGTFQAMFWPVFGSQAIGVLVKTETPPPSAPRKRGQFRLSSSADAASGTAACSLEPRSFSTPWGPLGKSVGRPQLTASKKTPITAPAAATDQRAMAAARAACLGSSSFGPGNGSRLWQRAA